MRFALSEPHSKNPQVAGDGTRGNPRCIALGPARAQSAARCHRRSREARAVRQSTAPLGPGFAGTGPRAGGLLPGPAPEKQPCSAMGTARARNSACMIGTRARHLPRANYHTRRGRNSPQSPFAMLPRRPFAALPLQNGRGTGQGEAAGRVAAARRIEKSVASTSDRYPDKMNPPPRGGPRRKPYGTTAQPLPPRCRCTHPSRP